jgi:ethanolamine permease
VIITVTSFIIMLFAYAQSPGYLTDDDTISGHTLPLNSGFMNGFQINDQWATIFSLPGLCISQATYIFGYGKQLRALAKSKLFPTFLSWTFKDSYIPYMALLTGSLLGFVVLLVLIKGLGMNYDSQPIDNLFNAALMGSYFTFMIMFVSYLVFTFQYANLARNYRSPLGVYGAVVGMIGMSFMFSGLVGFTNDNFGGLIYFFVFIGICSVYYYFHARKRQMFSQEEQDVLFEVYLMSGKRQSLIIHCY